MKIPNMKMPNMKTSPAKLVPKYGTWVEKKTRTEILLCVCGAKYLKTRDKQTTCIACMRRSISR